jgi:hypothetical protein
VQAGGLEEVSRPEDKTVEGRHTEFYASRHLRHPVHQPHYFCARHKRKPVARKQSGNTIQLDLQVIDFMT